MKRFHHGLVVCILLVFLQHSTSSWTCPYTLSAATSLRAGNLPSSSTRLSLFDPRRFAGGSGPEEPGPTLAQQLALGTRASTTIVLQGFLASEALSVVATKLNIDLTWALMAVNSLVYLLWQRAIDEGQFSDMFKFMKGNFLLSKGDIENNKFRTILLAGFSHLELTHLTPNLLSLAMLGPKLSKYLGTTAFSRFFVASIYASDLYDQLIYTRGQAPKKRRVFFFFKFPIIRRSLGASGAISACLTFCCLNKPRERLGMKDLIGLEEFQIPTWIFWSASVLYDLFPQKGTNIGHGAHIGGHLFGGIVFVVARIWKHLQQAGAPSVSSTNDDVDDSSTTQQSDEGRLSLRARIASAFRRMRSGTLHLAKIVVLDVLVVVDSFGTYLAEGAWESVKKRALQRQGARKTKGRNPFQTLLAEDEQQYVKGASVADKSTVQDDNGEVDTMQRDMHPPQQEEDWSWLKQLSAEEQEYWEGKAAPEKSISTTKQDD